MGHVLVDEPQAPRHRHDHIRIEHLAHRASLLEAPARRLGVGRPRGQSRLVPSGGDGLVNVASGGRRRVPARPLTHLARCQVDVVRADAG